MLNTRPGAGYADDDLIAGFGADVFNAAARKKHLSSHVYDALEDTITNGVPLDPAMVNEVANGMKAWAMSMGATHFSHWFQPLTRATAEKHDSFFTPDRNGGVVAQFSGKDLIQGEPDASSFPSGGLRATFEARGYTAWDPTSPAFVINSGTPRAVLCIPCVFCGYHGEALDEKAPLLRSQAALAKQVERVGRLFETPYCCRPYATLGAEQEYFLVDSRLCRQRPDLVRCGRTLFGSRPSGHQQMEAHYFGRIKPRILAFMSEVDRRLWRLGVPAKTRHNEASPGQFELAAVFEEQNLASDHNMLVMHMLQDTAAEHGFTCLLHEKPFAGVNGSGKHNNWSIVGTDGKNWLTPGETPRDNAKFLFMLIAAIKAVDTHASLIRASVATAGNDHRLGANEAPPAIMSIYLGEQLEDILNQLETGVSVKTTPGHDFIEIGVDALPKIPRDFSDRNRTSPFAFTGNKFEFRAVGSSQGCSGPNTILNLAMAAALDDMCSALEAKLAGPAPRETGDWPRLFHDAVKAVLRKEIKAHRRIIFDGDGYSQEWQEEALKRGLPNLRTSSEALAAMLTPEALSLFSRYGVLNEREVMSRYEVFRRAWEETVAMEGGLALHLARTLILPAALSFEASIAASIAAAKSMGRDPGARKQAYDHASDLVDRLYAALAALEASLSGAPADVVARLALLRAIVDKLEAISPGAAWPLPGYEEMFFSSTRR